jgi:hypothetical protein
MKDDHFRNVFELKTSCASAMSPFHILGNQDPRKGPHFEEVVAANYKVTGSGISMTFDV